MKSTYIQHISIIVIIFTTIFMSTGCVHFNAYEDFYTSYIPNKDSSYKKWIEKNKPVFLKENEAPEIISTDNLEQSLREYESDHYIILGESSFRGGLQSLYDLEEFAISLGATVVLKQKSKYMHSSTSGGGSYINFSKGVVSRAPIRTSHTYSQGAYFLVRTKTHVNGIGFNFNDLTEMERTAYKLNKGVKVRLVIKGTPAFQGNLFRDDIITHYGNYKINNTGQLKLITKEHLKNGGKNVVRVIRDGVPKNLHIEVTLPTKEEKEFLKAQKSDKEFESNEQLIGHVLKSNKTKFLAQLKNAASLKKGDELALVNKKGSIRGKAEILKINKKSKKAILKFNKKVKKGTKLALLDDSFISRNIASVQSISKGRYYSSVVVGGVVGFGTGHWIQGRYLERGWIFTLAPIVAVALGYATSLINDEIIHNTGYGTTEANISEAMVLGILGIKIWETYDLWKLPSYYSLASNNSKLKPEFYSYNQNSHSLLSLKWKW